MIEDISYFYVTNYVSASREAWFEWGEYQVGAIIPQRYVYEFLLFVE